MYEITTNTEDTTIHLGENLAMLLNPGDVVTLEGDLGTGKTTFTKGIAAGLGVKRNVSSPTFTIIKEYEGEIPFYHMDVYRLENSEEDIGFDEYFNGEGITVVEWPQFIGSFLPEKYLEVKLTAIDEKSRKITFIPHGSHFEWVVEQLKS
ncbi:tRNA (adenosine(37)-N6)-threonylcarbamoyltransferase complex ATPase subunit type 1 TsaE [Virgibacillus pantothenticus]|uniref:tRNA threonylcarbamoyladenosine biosynthesis protein TsaE n=1 Tax=Virgibacillus pantothenticus TaxID=1473 RepID=A0A0L0QJF2_VIRPA|nr:MULTISPECIES: tRNA (adenosine(37)-N6)-threonylcarbamoyltransferase complex ATPase subunit type 1 TsaE [Virgibacillus]API91634.1 tRNA (adenosine(37)-N6)-threonylcarbamoyltransferase complex ATPase subunit type 1 TsaE [Virgibacillus sp. 6R]KNE18692.1 ATP-binding protein [Virgibacillus pantothenticus]MBS7426836.1 tRNA (adenosine(37)-N6)-threonylcarbamoyltransferase complex ATPase subunit type 1 TsaE [Virgibacillus sp. 19R1-5]MBU8568294.1 tRNA (adenosine(37)-N6)-threonylcarbamoyltransferase comp